ncbi:MAG TPA: hypothetical protein VK846_01795 [Candidatus Limnocylindria bacterium]|nr:hypothetical protein [Candidatus Limnocylindria bacterium]
MRARIWLAAVTVFWLSMSVLLWRSEFGEHRLPGSTIPPGVVWQKILTAPDTSHLEVRHGTNVIGLCHWRPEVGQERATGAQLLDDEENPLEGMVQQLAYYTLDLDGNMTPPGFPTRVRFSFHLKLDTNNVWQTFDLNVSMRPDIYELSADVSAQTVRLRVDAGGDQINRTFRFAEFQNPQRLLRELGGPMFPALAAGFGIPLSTNKLSANSLGLRWEARNDSLVVGENRVRAYRLQTKVFDRYRITFFISPVGELLRAELPGELVLVNEALAGLRTAAP